MKKKEIKKITISRDTDNEIMVYADKELLTSSNSIDAVIEIISDILWESSYEGSTDLVPSAGTIGCEYKLNNST